MKSMTKGELNKIIEIYKPKYDDLELEIPTYIRNRDAQESESLQRIADDLRQQAEDLVKISSINWTDMLGYHCISCHKNIDKIESTEYDGLCETCASERYEAYHDADEEFSQV